jgi:predicted PurR-regulated permease PerM
METASKRKNTVTRASRRETDLFVKRVVEATIRVGVLVLVGAWCFLIVAPFLIPVAWGIIIAVAAYPFYLRSARALGSRPRLAAALVSVLLLLALIGPVVLLGNTLFQGAETLARQLREGGLVVPLPPRSVESWPLVGKQVAGLWTLAAQNLAGAVAQVAPQLKPVASWLVASFARAGLTLIQFVIAILIAGVLLAHADYGEKVARALARRLATSHGEELADIATATVRSVTRGILGVAFIQATLAGLGFLVMGVPGAGLWALVCLVLGIVQLPMGIVQIPAVIYVFVTAQTLPAVLFLIWNVLIMPVDSVLKPILLGRGVKVPMAVIFVGAIGGAISFGILGLFVGAVVLVLAYKLFLAWLENAAITGEATDKADTSLTEAPAGTSVTESTAGPAPAHDALPTSSAQATERDEGGEPHETRTTRPPAP